MANPNAVMGALLAILAGIMNGVSMLPMRYLGRWEWENVWLAYIVICCVLMPFTVVLMTVGNPLGLIMHAPVTATASALICGSLWGLGAIMFGQAVSAAGISLTNTLVMSISASLGSLLPLFLVNHTGLSDPHGRMVLIGTAITIAGMVISGIAGHGREHDHKKLIRAKQEPDDTVVGKRRPIQIALALCVGAGILSAVFNVGFSLAQPLITTIRDAGLRASDGTNLVWLLMLGSGGIVNTIYCVYLLVINGSARRFLLSGCSRFCALTAVMGLTWGGSIFAYGEASNRLGQLGPAIGWPLFLTTALAVANLSGVLVGEWRSTSNRTRWWMGTGLVTLVLAILVLGKAGSL